LRAGQITAQVRFKGGATRTIPISSLDTRATDPEVVAEIDRLLDQHTRGEIAALLNERGLRPVDGKPFTVGRVGMIERYYSLKSRHQRLRETGLLTRSEMAQVLNISERTVVRLHADGRLRGQKCDHRSHFLYHASANAPLRTPEHAARNNLRYEVQYEA
jgi:excisionase family DNA binding protein